MEQVIIGEMAALGFTEKIGDIFLDWETVKDEILEPDKKTGTGNGTIHVFLGKEGYHLFQILYPDYFNQVKSTNETSANAPKVKHFFSKANLISSIGHVCNYYVQKNETSRVLDLVTNVAAKLNESANKFFTTESLFKWSIGSSDLRPYFKQFDEGFQKTIRPLLLPNSAYKISLYKNKDNECAAFWLIGFSNVCNFEITADKSELETLNVSKKVIIRDKVLKNFVLDVFKYLYENKLLDKLESYSKDIDSEIVKLDDLKGNYLTGLFISTTLEDLKIRNSSTPRWFEYPFYFNKKNVFLSTQWVGFNSKENYQLKLLCLKNIIEDAYCGRFTMLQDNNDYVFIETTAGKRNYRGLCPLQTIYYGAPGTGKSYEVNRLTEGDDTVIRTTFHPDSDYASFVGCYKPVEKENVPLMQVVSDFASKQAIGIPVLDAAGNAVYDKSITYKFTQQAFLKAYIQAWKKMSSAAFPMTQTSVSFLTSRSGISYTVKSVENDKIVLRFVREIAKKNIENRWCKRLISGQFEWPNNNTSSDTQIDSICKWIFETFKYSETQLPEDWWENVLSELEKDVTINGKSDSTVYVLNKQGEKIFIANDDMFCKKDTLRDYYNDESKVDYESYSKVAGILRGINPDDFETAWKGLKEKVDNTNQSTETDAFTPQYLVIEEINRGNCAQIFGDIFQLLDRNDQGFSTYPIVPDADITRELKEVFKNLDLSAVEKYINGIFSENYPSGIVDKIKSGELLVLPNNLFILATMNTSDQSLFPMDSAFKRRWEWEYVKIAKGTDKNGNELDWRIGVQTGTDWWAFIQKINAIIASMTSSADKQLGYFFCKADDKGVISYKTFVNKVCFYLWNDVFKDYGFEDKDLFRYEVTNDSKKEAKDLTFPDFFDDLQDDGICKSRVDDFIQKVLDWKSGKGEYGN